MIQPDNKYDREAKIKKDFDPENLTDWDHISNGSFIRIAISEIRQEIARSERWIALIGSMDKEILETSLVSEGNHQSRTDVEVELDDILQILSKSLRIMNYLSGTIDRYTYYKLDE